MNVNSLEITEETMKERGITPLIFADIEKSIIGKTMKGDWGNARKYVCYIEPNGAVEGKNDLGTHSKGKWFIDKMNNMFSVVWESYWDNWSGRVYNVNGNIMLFDGQTHKMRTLIHTIEDGRKELKL